MGEKQYNSKYGLIKEHIRILPNRRFVPSSIYCAALNATFDKFEITVGGAGFSKQEAVLATLGEFSERYVASFPKKMSFLCSSHQVLQKNRVNVVSLSTLNKLYSVEQYATLKNIRPINSTDVIQWSECTSLFDNQNILLPSNLIFLNQEKSFIDGAYFIHSNTSTGLSAHITEKNAIENGFLENIERHSFCEFWYLQNSKEFPLYDGEEILKVFKFNRNIQELYNNPSILICCYDLTTICNIPTFLNIIFFKYKEKLYMSSGASARFSYETALIKAMIEAYQGVELALWLDKEYRHQGYFNANEILNSVTDFHKHFAFYNLYPCFREKVPVLYRALNSSFKSDKFCKKQDIISSFDVENIKSLSFIENIYYKNITTQEIAPYVPVVVKVIIPGLHLLTGNYNFPFLGSFKQNQNLFTEFPHFFPKK